MQTTASIDIQCPLHVVFRLTCDHVADWSTLVVTQEILEKQSGDVGTTFRLVTEEDGQQMEFQGRVTRCDPPHLHALRMMGDTFDIEAEYRFQEVDGLTRVTQTSQVRGKRLLFRAFLWCFGPFLRKSSRQALHRELSSLKAYCENPTTAKIP